VLLSGRGQGREGGVVVVGIVVTKAGGVRILNTINIEVMNERKKNER